ncbi:restriction endonuclease subunit S [Campylobacter vicugnae]|uniref:restriction endonuclease subunit S n=1 Tax=Campylobacter vicugnae TaxID=1660076 RepID=UPI00254F2E8E|nr:restriction endonuclease subunit S [Campylobacter ovis]MDL0096154.1 restriction endonuclease subunit S [Campylobacter ovis]
MAKIKKDTNLRKAILQAAITGQLISNVEGATETGKQLLDRIIEERNAKLLADWEEAKKKNPKAKKPAPIVASEIAEDEIPFEIPESWCWCRLGDVIDLLSGRDLEPSEYNSLSKGIPYMTGASNFENEKLLVNRWTDKPATISRFGDLLITCKGTIGELAINHVGEIHIARQIMAIRNTDFINLSFLKFFLISRVDKIQKQAKSMIPGISREDMLGFLFPLPPLAVQNAIVAKLEEVLPLVDAYENAVLQKEELKTALPDKVKKAILQEAIQGKLTEEWRKTATIEETGKQLLDRIIEERNAKLLAQWEEAKKKNPKAKKPTPIVASEIAEDEIPFEIPESWCWCRLSNLCNLYTGNSINETEKKLKYTNIKDGWVYIGTKDVGFDQTINYDNGIKIPFEKDTFRIAPKNTVLMCIEGGSAGRKIAFTNQDVCFGNKLCCFNPYKYEVEKFLFYFLQSTVFTDAFKDNINGIIGGVSINKIKDMLFPLPPLAEQEKIVEIIEQMLPLCEKLERKENINDK